jgi:hypothetical protein
MEGDLTTLRFFFAKNRDDECIVIFRHPEGQRVN